jgi:levansucrase
MSSPRQFAGPETPAWTRAQAAGVERTDSNVAPVFYPPREKANPSVHVWDTWPLRNRDGSLAEVGDYRVVFSLTAPADLLPGKRHDVATIRYFYSADGETWTLGGRAFDGGALGSRQWAGSALLDDGDLYLYYTAAGRAGEEHLSYGQRLAMATGGDVSADDSGVSIEGPMDHRVLLEPDGERYEQEHQSRGQIYTFRDPWFYEDGATGETYLLFEANTPVPEGSDRCGGDAEQQAFNGSVGIAHSPTGDPTDWELRDPLLDAVCVNQELERPHLLERDDRYYLFVSSHKHTFAPGLEGPDGLYGFVADSLFGEYRPLNGHGLVLTNPTNAPFQSYSYVVVDHPEDPLVTSFLGYVDYDRESLDDVALLPEAEQFRRFGGTFAPTVRLGLDGDRSWLSAKYGHGFLPLAHESLPDDPFEGVVEAGDERRGYTARE